MKKKLNIKYQIGGSPYIGDEIDYFENDDWHHNVDNIPFPYTSLMRGSSLFNNSNPIIPIQSQINKKSGFQLNPIFAGLSPFSSLEKLSNLSPNSFDNAQRNFYANQSQFDFLNKNLYSTPQDLYGIQYAKKGGMIYDIGGSYNTLKSQYDNSLSFINNLQSGDDEDREYAEYLSTTLPNLQNNIKSLEDQMNDEIQQEQFSKYRDEILASIPQQENIYPYTPQDFDVDYNINKSDENEEEYTSSFGIPSPNIGFNPSNNKSYAFNYLQQKGFAPHIAAGIVGNFVQESNLNPSITNSIGAFGAGQWLGSRKKDLFNYAKSIGRNPNDLKTQLDFTVHELNTTENKALKKLLKTSNAEDAAITFREAYERPGKHEANDKRRIREAQALYPFKHGGIYIKPENRGKFNALKKRTGKTTEELTHSKNPLTRKRAIFAQNASKWHHKYGGEVSSFKDGGTFLDYLKQQNSPISDRGNFSNIPYTSQQANTLKNVRNIEKALAQDKLNQEISARQSKKGDSKFILPNGESKYYQDMNLKEKAYVNGLSLQNKGRWNENSVEQPFLNNLNPIKWVYDMAANIGQVPLNSQQSNSIKPYLSAIGEPLLAGALGFSPIDFASKQLSKNLLKKSYTPDLTNVGIETFNPPFKGSRRDAIDFIGKEEIGDITRGAYGYPKQVSGSGMNFYPSTPNRFLNKQYRSFTPMQRGLADSIGNRILKSPLSKGYNTEELDALNIESTSDAISSYNPYEHMLLDPKRNFETMKNFDTYPAREYSDIWQLPQSQHRHLYEYDPIKYPQLGNNQKLHNQQLVKDYQEYLNKINSQGKFNFPNNLNTLDFKTNYNKLGGTVKSKLKKKK